MDKLDSATEKTIRDLIVEGDGIDKSSEKLSDLKEYYDLLWNNITENYNSQRPSYGGRGRSMVRRKKRPGKFKSLKKSGGGSLKQRGGTIFKRRSRFPTLIRPPRLSQLKRKPIMRDRKLLDDSKPFSTVTLEQTLPGNAISTFELIVACQVARALQPLLCVYEYEIRNERRMPVLEDLLKVWNRNQMTDLKNYSLPAIIIPDAVMYVPCTPESISIGDVVYDGMNNYQRVEVVNKTALDRVEIEVLSSPPEIVSRKGKPSPPPARRSKRARIEGKREGGHESVDVERLFKLEVEVDDSEVARKLTTPMTQLTLDPQCESFLHQLSTMLERGEPEGDDTSQLTRSLRHIDDVLQKGSTRVAEMGLKANKQRFNFRQSLRSSSSMGRKQKTIKKRLPVLK